jgi:hypothetical protein
MSAVALSHISLKITELDPGTYNYDANFSSFSCSARANAEIGTCNAFTLSIQSFFFPDFKS